MSKRVRKPSALALEAQQSAREQEDEPDEPDEPEVPGRQGKKRAAPEEDEVTRSLRPRRRRTASRAKFSFHIMEWVPSQSPFREKILPARA